MPTERINREKLKKAVYFISLSFLLTVSVIPGFRLIGNLLEQVLVTVIGVLSILFISDKRFCTPDKASSALTAASVFWILFSICKQVSVHIACKDKSLHWINIFYYDRPALLFVLMLTVISYYIVAFYRRSGDEDFIRSYRVFQKRTFRLFFLYYFLIFLYGFVIIRYPDGNTTQSNLIPFMTIRRTFFMGYFDYENITLFFGNIFIFFPMGIIAKFILKKKHKPLLCIIPIAVSLSIEVIQRLLNCGNFDVDDILLNVLGYYLGVLVVLISDRLTLKFTKGKYKSLFLGFDGE